MDWLVKAVVTGIASFVATNIDDIFILMVFFGQMSAALRPRHIVIGQYLGFGALVGISLVGYFARLVLAPAYIGFLGVLPIILGLRHFKKARESQDEDGSGSTETGGVLAVAAVTFANGADNIGIYTPLFAASDLRSLLTILVVFFLMVAVWCLTGYFLGSHPKIKHVLERYGHIIVPFVLIGLGLYIMAESGTLALLGFH